MHGRDKDDQGRAVLKNKNSAALEKLAIESLKEYNQQQQQMSPAELTTSTVTGLQIRKLDDVRAEVLGMCMHAHIRMYFLYTKTYLCVCI
jgi:hypothetical protein